MTLDTRASRLCVQRACLLQSWHLPALFAPRTTINTSHVLSKHDFRIIHLHMLSMLLNCLEPSILDALPCHSSCSNPTPAYHAQQPIKRLSCLMSNAMPPSRNSKERSGTLHKRYAISQIDCLFHCLIPISLTNLFILILSASQSLSAYLSDRPLASTRTYSIS